MRTPALFMLLFAAVSALAEDLHFSQSGAGSHSGAPGNEWSVDEASSAANWGEGSGQIGAGDTLHAAGIIAGSLTCQGGGTAGFPLVIRFDPGARFSAGVFPASGAINCNGYSHITVDGGGSGIIENTDNGSGLGHQQQSVGISAQLVNSLEVRGLTVRNIYRHTSNTDTTTLDSPDGAIYFGHQTNVFIHDCTFSDAHWAVNLNYTYGSTRDVTISNCFFYNVDHGVIAGGYGNAAYNLTNLYVLGNTFSNYANWDTTASVYHHDGVHVFGKAGAVAQNITISGNVFKGEIGDRQCTGHVYCEADDQGGTGGSGGYQIYNNLFLPPGNHGNFGTISGGGIGVCNGWVANNTIYGVGVENHYALRFSAGTWGVTNNIVVGAWAAAGTYSLAGATPNCSFDHNLYVSIGGGEWNGTPWEIWRASNDFHSITNESGGLTPDGLPQPGSPCIEAGANLGYFFTTDIAGTLRNSPWYIGAYQSLGIPPPNIFIAPTNLNFGALAVGTSSNLSITVQNTGGGTLTGAATVTAPFSIVGGNAYILPAGRSLTITVAYTPTAAGSNAQTIPFTGAAGALAAAAGSAYLLPALSIAPTNLNFGCVVLGSTSNLSITAQNTGGGTLTGTATATAPFSIVAGSNYSLAAGRSQTVTVAYIPTAVGTKVQNITFTGAGGAVATAAGSACVLPELSIIPNSLKLGVIVVGSTSNLSITVQNTSGASATDPFSMAAGDSLIVMGPGRADALVLSNPTSAIPSPPTASPALGGGTNCPGGLPYRILTATNLALPLARWIPVLTNTLTAAGDFAYTNSTTNGSAYFRLVSP